MKKYFTIAAFFIFRQSGMAQTSSDLNVNWDKTLMLSKTVTTLQIVNCPEQERNSPVHDEIYGALKKLHADYVRDVAWFIYPKLGVAELDPPNDKKTYWDFTLLDPFFIDFVKATKGHNAVFNYSTIPQWMFKTDNPVTYSKNPHDINWAYGYKGGKELRDTTMQELANYFSRIVSWYHKGGFTDELGKYHKSGYHYAIPYWEVFNEPDAEHAHTPAVYTKRYDAIVTAIKQVSPETKFAGLALISYWAPKWFEYFLNPANHKPGVPLDMISYHFYSSGNVQTIEALQYSYFDRSDAFLNCVRYIESIRKRLSPTTKSALDELGTFVNEETRKKPIPDEYWNLSASVYAYLYIELSKLGIDVIGESHLVGFNDAFPEVCMMNGISGKPNARYWVLKMIKDNFSPGDSLAETNAWAPADADYTAQGFVSAQGKKVLILNKRNKTISIKVPAEFKAAKLNIVDIASGEKEPVQTKLNGNIIEMQPFAVAVVSLTP